ncbi:hypothetical protein ACFL4B_01525 [Candidatus Neomarinimicrobiota bacterium]
MGKIKITNIIISFLLGVLSLTSCNDRVDDLTVFLDSKEVLYEKISIHMGTEYWNLYSGETIPDLITPKQKYADLFTNDTLNDLIDKWYEKKSKIKNPTLKRRVEVWHNVLTAAKVNYSEENLKLQNELEYWLAADEKTEGMPTEEEMKTKVIKLMQLRNERSQTLGYNNYSELILDVTEIELDWLISFADILDKRTLEPYKKLIEDFKSAENITEFNYSDALGLIRQYYANQLVPQVKGDSIKIGLKMIMDRIGFDYDKFPVRYIENEMPPAIGGQGIAVQIPNDFRIALLPGMDFQTWMHELGHGLQAIHTTVQSPILKEYEWCLGSECGGFSEGMAEVSAKISLNEEWVNQISPMSEDTISEMTINANLYRPAYLRFWLNLFMFEVEFYKNLDQDPDELKRQLTQKYLILDNPPERVRPVADMAIVSYPLYIQNYAIAEIVSWQVHRTLQDKYGKEYSTNMNVAQFLIDNFYKDGGLYLWQDRLQKATGKELDLDGYLVDMGL